MGVEVHPLLTAVLSNQTAYESFKSLSLTDTMKPFIEEWKKLGAKFDGIIGIAAVKEHLPKPDKSLITAHFFKKSPNLFYIVI